jgi:hypothetical protein
MRKSQFIAISKPPVTATPIRQLGLCAEFPEIQSGAERRIGAGHDDNVDGVVVVYLGKCREEPGTQLLGQRIADVRPVQCEHADTVPGLDQQHRCVVSLGHGGHLP